MTCATTDDIRLLRAIEVASDGLTTAALIRDYYRDGDRSDRTPREFLYLHLGLLSGIIERMWREQAAAPPAPTAEPDEHRRLKYSQMDLDAQTKPLHVEIERLRAAPPERVSEGKEP